MKVFVAIGTTALFMFGVAASAYAHNTERVRRELEQQGYDQIEFKRTKPPFWVDVCRGPEQLHLHVDYYGKITKETVTGTCPGRETPESADASPEITPGEDGTLTENSSIATAREASPEDTEPKTVEADAEPETESEAATSTKWCKRFFPATGMTLTVACE